MGAGNVVKIGFSRCWEVEAWVWWWNKRLAVGTVSTKDGKVSMKGGGNGCGLVGRVLASSNEKKKKQLISSNKARRNKASLSLYHTKRTMNETIKMSIWTSQKSTKLLCSFYYPWPNKQTKLLTVRREDGITVVEIMSVVNGSRTRERWLEWNELYRRKVKTPNFSLQTITW